MDDLFFSSAAKETVPEYAFDEGDGFRYRNAMYSFVETKTAGHVLKLMDGSALQQGFTHKQFEDMRHETDPLQYLPKHYFEGSAQATFKTQDLTATLGKAKRESLMWRDKICQEVIRLEAAGKLSRSDDSIRSHLIAICKQAGLKKSMKKEGYKHGEVKLPCPSTVRRWLRAYEASEDIVALTDNYKSRPGSTTFSANELQIMQKYAKKFAGKDRLKMKHLHEQLCDAIDELNLVNKGVTDYVLLRKPEIKAFRKRIHALGSMRNYAGRNGDKAAKVHYAALMEGLQVLRPLERVEMDEYLTDLHVVLAAMGIWETLTPAEQKKVPRIRLWITAIIDVATRVLLAMDVHDRAPSIKTAVAAVEMATRDKTAYAKSIGCQSTWEMEGTFELIAVDSASWYVSDIFYLMIRDLGATLFLPTTGAASARGTIERFFRTVSGQAFTAFTGRTWSSPEELGDADPRKEASIAFDQVRPLVTRFAVDVYHHTPHEGLAMETPYSAWKRLRTQYKTKPSPTGARRRHIFGTAMHRKIHRGGFTVSLVEYQAVHLQELGRDNRKEVLVRVDARNLGAASYFDGTNWCTARAKNPAFEGMTLWEWIALCSEARKLGLDEAKLSQSTRANGLKHLREQGRLAALVAGHGEPQMSDEDYEKLEEWFRKTHRKAIGGEAPENFGKHWDNSAEFMTLLGFNALVVQDSKDIDATASAARRATVEAEVAEAEAPAKSARGVSMIDPDYQR